MVEAGVIRPSSHCSAMGQRLAYLYEGIEDVLDAFPPARWRSSGSTATSSIPRTSILMAHARGVIVLAAATRGIPVFGYAAARVKKTLTGSGRAPKPQIQHAIMTELRLAVFPNPTTSPTPAPWPSATSRSAATPAACRGFEIGTKKTRGSS